MLSSQVDRESAEIFRIIFFTFWVQLSSTPGYVRGVAGGNLHKVLRGTFGVTKKRRVLYRLFRTSVTFFFVKRFILEHDKIKTS